MSTEQFQEIIVTINRNILQFGFELLQKYDDLSQKQLIFLVSELFDFVAFIPILCLGEQARR
jgi:hypothetical protein